MSVAIPMVTVGFGGVGVARKDVIELKVHLGCTKEVSSFELLLQNWNKQYSPGGITPINVGMDGYINVGRGDNIPQIISCRVEKVQCESTSTENYIRISGRCWGEKLFRRVVTKTYESMKGEDVVRDLIDYYVGLSHTRTNSALTSDAEQGQKDVVVADGSIFSAGDLVWIQDDNASEYNEVASVLSNTVTMVNNLANTYTVAANGKVWIDLIEKTDTTFTELNYENTPVWDILKYIAESSDKAGVIGYDFRVAPDGKFEFFPKNSKTSPVSLSEKIEVSAYRKDIHRIRNKIMIYGLADKSVPADKDAWTESLTPDDGSWSAVAGEVSLDTVTKAKGSASIKLWTQNDYYGSCCLTLNDGKEVNANLYPFIAFWIKRESSYNGTVKVILYDVASKTAAYIMKVGADEWLAQQISCSEENADIWNVDAGFDWTQIKEVRFDCDFDGTGTGSFWIDGLYFGGRRYAATREDASSQSSYGLRELVEVDEELTSDNECDLRAKALLDYFKDPAEYLRLRTTVLDYGNNPLLPADKIHVILPNENVDSDFRIESVEYYVDARTQTLEVMLELGKVPPLLADYIYGLRATTVTVEKLARTKLGKGAIKASLGSSGGGGFSGGNLIPASDDIYDIGEGTTPKRWRDLYLSGAIKALANGVQVHLLPNVGGTYDLGSDAKNWSNIFSNGLCKVGWLNVGDYTVITSSRVLQNVFADAAIITSGRFPLARLPVGSSGYVLEAQGAGYNPMYVDPDYRYKPKGHNHAAGNITSGVLDEARCPNVYTGLITFNGGIVTNSVNCANWQATDIIFENKFRVTEAEKLGLGKGLAFLNPKGEVVMFLDEDGNVEVSGELKEKSELKKTSNRMRG